MIAPYLLSLLLVADSSLLGLETSAQAAIAQVLNSLPEGLLVAFFAWAVLRILPKQNSRTRFAVWFVALFAVVGIACVGGATFTGQVSGMIFNLASATPSVVHAINLPAHWAFYIFVIWSFIATVGIARIAVGVFHLRKLRETSVPVKPTDLDPLVLKTLEDLYETKSFASRRVTLATSDQVRVPAALGIWEPMIVLPSWALSQLPASDLSIILRHEFAHLERWDDWTNLLQKFVRAVFFFHPAVWWIESRLSSNVKWLAMMSWLPKLTTRWGMPVAWYPSWKEVSRSAGGPWLRPSCIAPARLRCDWRRSSIRTVPPRLASRNPRLAWLARLLSCA